MTEKTFEMFRPASSRRAFLGMALGSAIAVGVAACGGSSGSSNKSNPSEAVPGKKGGTLRYGRFDLTRFNPQRSSAATDNEVLFIVFDRLIHVKPDGTLIPGLAEKWEIAKDGMSLTLNVRPKVTFHDGTPLDAAAVKANLDYARTKGSSNAADLASITNVVVVDSMTVRLELSSPNSALTGILSDRAGALMSPKVLSNSDLDTTAVGAGMYKLVKYSKGVGGTFVKYDGYWDPDAQGLDTIDFRVFANTQALFNAIRANEIDYAQVDPNAAKPARQAGFGVLAGPSRAFMNLNLNETHNHLDDVRVRRALAHAIDRKAILSAVFFDEGEVTSQLFPRGDAGYNEDIAPEFFKYDPEQSKKLLKEAGFANGLTLQLMTNAGLSVPETNQILEQQFAKVGIKVEFVQADVTTVADRFFTKGECDMLTGPWSGRPAPEQTIGGLNAPDGFANPGGWAPPEFTPLYKSALTATNDADRTKALKALAKLAADQVQCIPIVRPYTPYVYQKKVKGLKLYVTGKNEFRGVTVDG